MAETSRGVVRALAVLRAINENRGAGVSRISHVTGISRAAIYRVVRTLEEGGYLKYDASSESLRLTPLVKQLSAGYDEEAVITDLAGPLLDDLQREVIWPTDLFCFFDDTMIMCRTTRRVSPWTFDKASVGFRIPLLITACGRAYLASAEARVRHEVLNRVLPASDANSLQRRETERVLEQVRTDGYALREVGFMKETGSIAVPVMVDDVARCSIAITYIATAIKSDEVIRRYAPLLQVAAGKISSAIACALA